MQWLRSMVIGWVALTGCSPTGGAGSRAWEVPGSERQGIATYYDATGAGACSFDTTSDFHVAAIDTANFSGSSACGACVEVQGPKGQVTVRIVGLCPDCDANHVDLSEGAFARIADPADGRVKVRWRPVPCEVSGNVSYRYKDGSSQYWTAIQVLNHRVPVASLALRIEDAWVDVRRESYNYFVYPAGAGTGPVKVRITGTSGEQLEDILPAVTSEGTGSGHAQFKSP